MVLVSKLLHLAFLIAKKVVFFKEKGGLMSLKLYSYFRSSSAYRVRIALNLKGLNYDYLPVHLLNNGGEQNSDEFKKLSPKAEVPALVHDGKNLIQSMAIIEYLDEVYPQNPLLFPRDPYLKSQVRAACEIINSGIQPLQNLRTLQKLQVYFNVSDEEKNQWISDWVSMGLAALDQLIKPYSKNFCFGHEVSAADIFLVPQIFSALRFNVDTTNIPKLMEIYEHCQQIKAFAQAAPTEQPDAPKS